jgi:hypothetical protein
MSALTSETPFISVFMCKKFKSTIDELEHHHLSFDLYFKGKKAAVFSVDPWSQETTVSYTSKEIEAEIDTYAKENNLYKIIDAYELTHLPEIYNKNAAFTTDNLVKNLSYLFAQQHENKKHLNKIKRLCKTAIVVGNDDEFVSYKFPKISDLTDILKYKGGKDALVKTLNKAKSLIEEKKGCNYKILNPKEQLDALGLE